MMNTFNLLRIELIKIKRSMLLLVIIAAPLFVTLLELLHLYLHGTPVVSLLSPWHQYITVIYITWLAVMMPLVIALIAAFYIVIENKAHGYKRLFTIPIKRTEILSTKFLSMYFFAFLTFSLVAVFTLISGCIVGVIKPEYHFLSTRPDLFYLICITYLPLIASFLAISIQFIIAFFTKKFVFTLGIGVFGVVYSVIAARFPISGIFSPWLMGLKILNYLPLEQMFRFPATFGLPLGAIIPISLIGTLCIILIGLFIIKRTDIE